MNVLPTEVQPPLLSIGFVPGHGRDDQALMEFCQLILEAGMTLGGWADVVRGGSSPQFQMVSDLAAETERVMIRGLEDLTGRRPLRVWFWDHQVGPAYASYAPARSGSSHPVTVTISGSALEGDHEPGSAPPSAEAEEARRFARRLFTQTCERLFPKYATVQVEASLPAEADLLLPGASLGTVLFVSGAVIEGAPGLGEKLTAIYAAGTTVLGREGFTASDSSTLNPGKPATRNAVAKGNQAARLVGLALMQAREAKRTE